MSINIKPTMSAKDLTEIAEGLGRGIGPSARKEFPGITPANKDGFRPDIKNRASMK